MIDLRPPAIFLPNAKSRVAPANPPTRLAVSSGIITRRGTSSRLRYAPPLAAAPVQRAIVLVALAGIGGTPVNSNAGKAMKLPPPATAFNAPPSAPAKNRNMIVFGVKLLGVPETSAAANL